MAATTINDLGPGAWFTFVPETKRPPDWIPPVWVKGYGKTFRLLVKVDGTHLCYEHGELLMVNRVEPPGPITLENV